MSKYLSITPSVGVDILTWGVDQTRSDLKKDEGDKIKFFELHSDLTWTITVNRDNEICVWDISCNSLLLCISIVELLKDSEQYEMNFNLLNRTRDENVTCSFSTPAYSACVATRMSMSKYYPILSTSSQNFESIVSSPHTFEKYSSKDKEVRQISFIDAFCISNLNRDVSSLVDNSFNSHHKFMVVCDAGVIFHDLTYSVTRSITYQDLGNKTPTSAEFIFVDFVAIGCSDGSIRIWDCGKWAEVKVISTGHSKGDILSIKNLPILHE